MNDTPTTPLRARISNGYRGRLILIGLGVTAFGCWALYDGFIGYPKKAQVFSELQAIQEERPDWASYWSVYAAERGYETNPNEIKELEAKDIWTQHVMAAICLPIGGFFLLSFLRTTGRTVEADENGIRGREGSATWDAVTDLDDSRWRTKGIARVKFNQPGGGEGRILLDDWKFDREPTVAIHDLVMKKLGKTPEGGSVEDGADGHPDGNPEENAGDGPEAVPGGESAEPVAAIAAGDPESDESNGSAEPARPA